MSPKVVCRCTLTFNKTPFVVIKVIVNCNSIHNNNTIDIRSIAFVNHLFGNWFPQKNVAFNLVGQVI